jgi:hypothetical protein
LSAREVVQETQNAPADFMTLRDNLKKFIKKESPIHGAEVEILSYENDCLTLGFPSNFIYLDEVKTTQKGKLEEITGRFFGKKVVVKVETSNTEDSSPTGGNGRNQASVINDVKREAMRQPLLQKVMDELSDAKVVEINVQTDKTNL